MTAIQGFTLPVAPFFGAFGPTIGAQLTPCSVTPGCTGVNVRPRYASTYQEDKHWVSHELNLSSSGDGALQWLVGAYYYKEGVKQPVFTTLFDQAQLASSGIVNAGAAVNPRGVSADNLLRPYDDRPASARSTGSSRRPGRPRSASATATTTSTAPKPCAWCATR
jgi:hypothetical protein